MLLQRSVNYYIDILISVDDIFAKLDGSSGIKIIITDRLNLGGLQVDDISVKITAESTKKYILIR